MLYYYLVTRKMCKFFMWVNYQILIYPNTRKISLEILKLFQYFTSINGIKSVLSFFYNYIKYINRFIKASLKNIMSC